MKRISARILSGFLLVMFLLPNISSAASLYIDPSQSTLNRGDALTMAVRLDTDESTGECVNAVDGVITYTGNIDPVDVSIGNSIFSLWIEQPVIDRENRQITFAGGMPNGYCGRVEGDPRLTNTIAELVFRLPGFAVGVSSDDPIARVEFSNQSRALLNDGLGTEASLTTYGAEIALNQRPGAEMANPWQERIDADDQPPEQFSIFLEKDDRAFAGKYYIVFNTTDKQTGIDHYEVMEEPISQLGSFQWGRADAPWVTARSPYVLEDQTLNSTIRVRAIDKAGNAYVATLIPSESQRTISKDEVIFYAFVAFLVLVVLLVLFTFVGWYRKMKRRRSETNSTDTEDEVIDGENWGEGEVDSREHDDEVDNEYDDEK